MSGVKADCRKVRNAFKAVGYPKRKILSQWKRFILRTLPQLHVKLDIAPEDAVQWLST